MPFYCRDWYTLNVGNVFQKRKIRNCITEGRQEKKVPGPDYKEESMEELNKKLRAQAKRTFLPGIVLSVICLLAGLALLGSALAIRKREFREMSHYSGTLLRTGTYYTLSENGIIIDSFASDSKGEYFILYRTWDEKWMSLYLTGSNKARAEAIMEENWEYFNGNADALSSQSISVKGRIREMSAEEKDYFLQWMEESGWTADEISQDSDLRTLDTSDTMKGMPITGGVLTLTSLIIMFYSLWNFVGGGYQKKVLKKITEKGISPERISSDLSNGTDYKGITVTPSYVIISGTGADILFYEDLVWVYGYIQTTVHKIWGIIPAGKNVTHYVYFVDRNKKNHIAVSRNKDETDQIVRQVISFAPYLIAGFSEQSQEMAREDFAGMVSCVDEKRAAF